MTNISVQFNSSLLKQQKIFKWLNQLSFHQIKAIISIKNPDSKKRLLQILCTQINTKQQVMKKGYNEASPLQIYHRAQFRHKKDKERKKEADKNLCQNLTISRIDKSQINVQQLYLQSGQLKKDMMILSEKSQHQSLWFKNNDFHSLGQWITRFFQIEIDTAYEAHKNYKCNIYNFLTSIPNQDIQNDLKKAITACSTKFKHQGNQSINKQKSEQQKKYLFGQCLERMLAYGRFAIQEYNWLQEDEKGQYFNVMSQLCQIMKQKFDNYEMAQQIQDIQKFQKNINKKKKKNKKKKNQAQKEEQQEQQKVQKQSQLLAQTQIVLKQLSQKIQHKEPLDIKQGRNIYKIVLLKEQSSVIKEEHTIKANTLQILKDQTQTVSPFIIIQHQEKKKEKKIVQKDIQKTAVLSQKIKQKLLKDKKIQKAVSSFLQNFVHGLTEQSQRFDRSRKQAKQLLQQTISALQLKFKWQLILFGSCEIGFALRQSDLDLVLKIQNGQKFSLTDLYNHLKINHWAMSCQLIKIAQIPIISLKINLLNSQKLTSRQMKKLSTQGLTNQKLQDLIVSVDISLSQAKEEYQGVTNTNNLRILFKQNEYLVNIAFLIKQLLRRKQLNRPYKGGVSSYVLLIMLYGIIKTKQNNIQTDTKIQTKLKKEQIQNLKSNIYVQLQEVSVYLESYVAFQTVINPLEKQFKCEAKEQLHLNIVDPFTKALVKTSAYRIYQIADSIHKLVNFCDMIKGQIKDCELESKKLKRQIGQNINEYFNSLVKDYNEDK